MSPRKKRRKFAPEAKAAILRRHLADKIPMSDLCEEYKIQPSLLYQWQRQLLGNAAAALKPAHGTASRERQLAGRVETLQSSGDLRQRHGACSAKTPTFAVLLLLPEGVRVR